MWWMSILLSSDVDVERERERIEEINVQTTNLTYLRAIAGIQIIFGWFHHRTMYEIATYVCYLISFNGSENRSSSVNEKIITDQNSINIFLCFMLLFDLDVEKMNIQPVTCLVLIYSLLMNIASVHSTPLSNNTLSVVSAIAIANQPICNRIRRRCYGFIRTCQRYYCLTGKQCANSCCETSCGSRYLCGTCFGFSLG